MSDSVKQGLITAVAAIIFCVAVALLMFEITVVEKYRSAYRNINTVMKEADEGIYGNP